MLRNAWCILRLDRKEAWVELSCVNTRWRESTSLTGVVDSAYSRYLFVILFNEPHFHKTYKHYKTVYIDNKMSRSMTALTDINVTWAYSIRKHKNRRQNNRNTNTNTWSGLSGLHKQQSKKTSWAIYSVSVSYQWRQSKWYQCHITGDNHNVITTETMINKLSSLVSLLFECLIECYCFVQIQGLPKVWKKWN